MYIYNYIQFPLFYSLEFGNKWDNNKDFENGTDIAIKIGWMRSRKKIKLESNNDDNKINEFERLNILYFKYFNNILLLYWMNVYFINI